MSEPEDAADRFLAQRTQAAHEQQQRKALVDRLRIVHVKLSVVVAGIESDPAQTGNGLHAAFMEMRDVMRDVLLWVQGERK